MAVDVAIYEQSSARSFVSDDLVSGVIGSSNLYEHLPVVGKPFVQKFLWLDKLLRTQNPFLVINIQR